MQNQNSHDLSDYEAEEILKYLNRLIFLMDSEEDLKELSCPQIWSMIALIFSSLVNLELTIQPLINSRNYLEDQILKKFNSGKV